MIEGHEEDVLGLLFVLSFLLATLMALAACVVLACVLLHSLSRLWAWLWRPTNPTDPTGGPSL